MMDRTLELLLHGAVVRLGTYSRDAFHVDLSLTGNGFGPGGACVCALSAEKETGDQACRGFAASLFTSRAPRARCPDGFSVVARPVNLGSPERLLLATHGFYEESGAPTVARRPTQREIPRLTPAEIARLEEFVEMGAGLLAELSRFSGPDLPEQLREEAWRDLLGAPTVVGVSPASRAMREALAAAATSAEPLFIAGERGSGRHFLAAAVHRLGPRANRPFVVETLASLPEKLQEVEIFGSNGTAGLVAEVENGTLFIADVERLTPRCQERLNALLQGREQPGGFTPRIIAAADVDLDEAVVRERFRRDLAESLRTRVIAVPPLRDRAEDIPLIAEHLVRRRAAASGRNTPLFTPEALEALRTHPWNGSFGELDEELARAAAGRTVIRPEDVAGLRARGGRAPSGSEDAPLRRAVGDLEVSLIEQALANSNWNKSRAARALGLSRLGLQKKIDRYGVDRRR